MAITPALTVLLRKWWDSEKEELPHQKRGSRDASMTQKFHFRVPGKDWEDSFLPLWNVCNETQQAYPLGGFLELDWRGKGPTSLAGTLFCDKTRGETSRPLASFASSSRRLSVGPGGSQGALLLWWSLRNGLWSLWSDPVTGKPQQEHWRLSALWVCVWGHVITANGWKLCKESAKICNWNESDSSYCKRFQWCKHYVECKFRWMGSKTWLL